MSGLVAEAESGPSLAASPTGKGNGKRRLKGSTDQLSFEDLLWALPETSGIVEPASMPVVACDQPTISGNYRITDKDQLGKGNQKAKFKDNISAIELLRKLEAEGRNATTEEQSVLVKYTGWGGMPQAFDYANSAWEEEYEELEKLLTEEEYDSARASTLNAHYTSPDVIRFMYAVLGRMGFKGGRFLEPSLGIGYFLCLMPDEMLSNSRLSGIELDSLSGRIAKQLCPDADIRVMGYESARFPVNFFDLAVSNVPFGDYKLHDPLYRKHKFSIHEYFFAKSLDLVRPGGIVAFITSRYLMDRRDASVRNYIYEKADLLGAVRLPCTAFKEIANTEVTSDIVFLRKREEGGIPGDGDWLEVVPCEVGDSEDVHINAYFMKNPHMMLGKLAWECGMYGRYDLSLKPDGRLLTEALNEVVHLFPPDIFETEAELPLSTVDRAIPSPDSVKEGAFVVHEGRLYRSIAGSLALQELPATTTKRVEKMVRLRDTARQLLHDEMTTADDASINFVRIQLNSVYDRFVKEFGYIQSRSNKSAFSEDPDYPLLLSLELYDDETKKAAKAEVFSRRVIHPVRKVERVETVKEAFLVTLNELGRVDFERMSSLTGKSESDIRDELEGLIFRNPEGGWEPADQYLSGNVRKKLEIAELAATTDPEFRKNSEALKAVQPKDIDCTEIRANLGASWIPAKDVEVFINELVDVKDACEVAYSPVIGTWTVEISAYKRWEVSDSVNNTTTWGTARCNAVTLIRDALNNRMSTVRDYEDDKPVINEKETEAAREKQLLVREHFKEWLWKDPERRERLAKVYNATFNCLRARTFDGSHLNLPGMSTHLTLMKHQKDAIWRIIQTGTTLIDHIVGAGKSFVIIAAAMEMRRLGLISKAMITVPNHLLEQWGAMFLRLYPMANVLIAGHDDFTPAKRKAFLGKIALNHWDAVIIAHSSFEKIPLSTAVIASHMEGRIRELEEAILSMREDNSGSRIVKELEKAKKRLAEKLQERLNEAAKDNGLTFEEIGVDMLFVDEADLFKNLFIVTKMSRIAGLPNADSKRAFDLSMKSQWLLRRRKPVVFATGTPVSNTIAEMYTMQRYQQPEMLVEHNISHFDSWAATFGEVVTSLEIAPDGSGYRMRSRFARFVNVPELLQMYWQVADVQTDATLQLAKPQLAGGKPIVVAAPASDGQKQFIKALVKRAEALRAEHIDPRLDNMLKITTDGRKAALDMRLVDSLADDFEMSKVNACVQKIYEEWVDMEDFKGTQLVFCDLSTPRGDGFSVYEDIREKLVRKGIPREEIAFIHEADTDQKKKTLFVRVNFGRVRVLIGSTEKMGAGTNVQRILGAEHHLDVPWRPRDVEQREGRILRQGNTNKTVRIYRYVTEGSFDAYMWQAVEAKGRFIAQLRSNQVSSRVVEDVEGVVLSYAEVKALASGNPLVMEKFKIDLEVQRLETLRSQHSSERYRLEYEVSALPARIENYKKAIEKRKHDLGVRRMPDPFRMEIDGTLYTERKYAGDKIISLANLNKGTDAYEKIGSYAGFDLYIRTHINGYAQPLIIARGLAEHKGNVSDNDVGTVNSLDFALRGIETSIAKYSSELAEMEKRLMGLTAELEKPFPHEERLRELLKKQYEINKELDIDRRDSVESAEEGAVITEKAA